MTHCECREATVENEQDRVSEKQAVRLWERAADAARAAEIAKATQMAAKMDAPTRPVGEAATDGYALAHVRAAALEAGIAPEFVDAAVAELRAEQALSATGTRSAIAQRFLDDPPDTLSARRVISGPPREVLAAMEALFVAEPYRLVLVDQRGDALAGGAMIFDIHSTVSPLNPGFGYQMYDAGVKQLAITLHPLAGEEPSCEVTVHGRVSSHNLSTGLGILLSSFAGAGGIGLGTAVGFALAGLGITTGVVPLLAIAGAAMGGAGGVKGFRALHRRSMRNATRALEALLGAVAGRGRGGWLGSLSGAGPDGTAKPVQGVDAPGGHEA